jgi:hypothetical protein
LKSSPISVNHPHAATSDILILLAAPFIQIVALYLIRSRGFEIRSRAKPSVQFFGTSSTVMVGTRPS